MSDITERKPHLLVGIIVALCIISGYATAQPVPGNIDVRDFGARCESAAADDSAIKVAREFMRLHPRRADGRARILYGCDGWPINEGGVDLRRGR